MPTKQRLTLNGCTPEPLLSYLKALGVLRLVSLQADSEARAGWIGGQFTLVSRLDREALLTFFLEQYRPTPVLAPWNGGSGFWDNTAAGKALKQVAESNSPRLAPYREALTAGNETIRQLNMTKKGLKDEKTKAQFLRSLRSSLPDDALDWIDATSVLADEKARFAPILGTGGNDGRLDYSANYMQRLITIIPFNPDQKQAGKKRRGEYNATQSRTWLEDALFAQGDPPLVKAALGQYHPGGVGGPNATAGFEGDSLVNPWDFVLMIEGTLVLAGAAARRMGADTRAKASFPFTVNTTAAGWGTLADSEESSSRAELWLPLWKQPASYPEVQRLFAEGRAQVGRRQAYTGLDFARAAASLGVDRGVDAFQRFGFLQRSGLAYLAAPLGRVAVREQPHARLIDQLDPWLGQLQRLQNASDVGSLARAVRRIEAAIFAFCEYGGPTRLQDVVAAAGAAERVVSLNPKWHDSIRPLHAMEPIWLEACDDGSPEFRLAAALASIYDPEVGALRINLEPVDRPKNAYAYVWTGKSPATVAGGGDLSRTLFAILERRLIDGERAGTENLPLRGRITASLADVHRFLTGQTDDQRILDLLAGLATLKWEKHTDESPEPDPTPVPHVNRSYALLKLLFLPRPLKLSANSEEIPIRPEPSILYRLRAHDLQGAIAVAYRRLWASGLRPLGVTGRTRRQSPDFVLTDPLETERLAAALLIPIFETRKLVNMAIRIPEEQRA